MTGVRPRSPVRAAAPPALLQEPGREGHVPAGGQEEDAGRDGGEAAGGGVQHHVLLLLEEGGRAHHDCWGEQHEVNGCDHRCVEDVQGFVQSGC